MARSIQESYESDSHSQLTLEYTLYSQLAATKGFCRVYDFGRVDNNVYMVMDRLAFTIEQLFDMCGRKFQAATVFRIAVQLIDRLEELHALGYLHRDINPRNIMVGEEDCSKLYLIDFGLAKSFLQPNSKEHIQRTSGHKFTGTVKFASVAAHEGYGRAPIKVDQSRRDDLESLGFVLVYLLKGLPWEEVKLTNKLARREKISAMKHSIITEELCKNLPSSAVLIQTSCFSTSGRFVVSHSMTNHPTRSCERFSSRQISKRCR